MSDNVTPIRPDLPENLGSAVQEQQCRVWRLRALIECMREGQGSGAVDDLEAAIEGCADYADSIHLALLGSTRGFRRERTPVLSATAPSWNCSTHPHCG